MELPQRVRIVEVGPRDGLQNEPKSVPTATKVELIEQLTNTGLPTIEATAFVSPKWMPQIADHTNVLKTLQRTPNITYPVLVPNMKGFETATAAGAQEIAIFKTASETFSLKNINASITESVERFAPVCETARAQGIHVHSYISCVVGC